MSMDSHVVRRPRGKHGYAIEGRRPPVYMIWQSMIKRCTNPKYKSWQHYGGRGITVCERWRAFASFLADMGEPLPNTSLDRIDNDRGYSPENCRWATREEQQRNTRRTRLNWDRVAEIRARAADGETHLSIAQGMNISEGSVWNVVHHRRWRATAANLLPLPAPKEPTT